MNSTIKIRKAEISDAGSLLEIYAPYVKNTAITFEYDVPSKEEFQERIAHTLMKYPYLIAETNGEVLGYAYAGAFKERKAYDWAVETTVYIKTDKKRMGIGRALYSQLEKILKLQGILNLNACIACPVEEDEYLTDDSIKFHKSMGYNAVGTFHVCGYKFNRWYDMDGKNHR